MFANKTKKDWLEGKRKQGVCGEQYSNIKQIFKKEEILLRHE